MEEQISDVFGGSEEAFDKLSWNSKKIQTKGIKGQLRVLENREWRSYKWMTGVPEEIRTNAIKARI